MRADIAVAARLVNATIPSGHDVIVLVGETTPVELSLSGHLSAEATLNFHAQHAGLVNVWPAPVILPAGPAVDVCITLEGRSPGRLQVTATVQPENGELR